MAKITPDLFSSSEGAPPKRRVYSVWEITQRIKGLLEDNFSSVWVEGEVSNFTVSSAGHWYFSLKDKVHEQEAVLSVAIFSRASRDVKFKLENGLQVVCCGSLNVYPPHGKYSLIVEQIEPKGIGSLQLALEQLKAKLQKEGLFALERKRPIPAVPNRIGIVTSATGAAIKDILKVLDRRFADLHVILNPVRVQGELAKEEIAQAIDDFNLFNQRAGRDEQVEVLIVGRGGGSIEDLWAFNEEIVARAIYRSQIPVVSAVGHERDVTVADLVADVRAATPSVAAELVVPRKEDLKKRIDELSESLVQDAAAAVESFESELDDLMHRASVSALHGWEMETNRVRAAVQKLSLVNPAVRIPEYAKKVVDLARQIYVQTSHRVELKRSEFEGLVEKMASLNPLNILARGYSVTFRATDGQIIKDSGSVKPGDRIRTRVHKGEIVSTVTAAGETRNAPEEG